MEWDNEKIDKTVLALLYLTLHDSSRAWKGHDWDVMNRLFEKGFISDPKTKSKSVLFTQEGLEQSKKLFVEMFGQAV